MKGWSLVDDAFDPAQERLRESLSTLGNGYFATRGAAPESPAGRVHYPGTYIAGCYNRLPTEIAGRELVHEDLVNAPNWLPLTFRPPGGAWFSLEGVDLLSYRQELDLRRGLLARDIRFRDEEGRTTRLRDRRLVHVGAPHLAALQTTVTPEDWSGRLEFRVALDGRVVNGLVTWPTSTSRPSRRPPSTTTLFERLGYPWAYETIPQNVDYYLRRSAHDSTLSRVADAWVLARADRPRSWDVFLEALVTDVADIQGGTTPEKASTSVRCRGRSMCSSGATRDSSSAARYCGSTRACPNRCGDSGSSCTTGDTRWSWT